MKTTFIYFIILFLHLEQDSEKVHVSVLVPLSLPSVSFETPGD
jgi:hypothetical protein